MREEHRASIHLLQREIPLVSVMLLQVSKMSEACLSLIKVKDRVLRRMVEVFWFPIAFRSVYPGFQHPAAAWLFLTDDERHSYASFHFSA